MSHKRCRLVTWALVLGIDSLVAVRLTAPPARAASTGPAAASPVAVLTCHNDGYNDGQNLAETNLTPARLRSGAFTKLFDVRLRGNAIGQPLFIPNVHITTGPNRGRHNVVLVCTSRDRVYALDANTGARLWRKSLLTTLHDPRDQVAAATGATFTGRGQPLEDTPVVDPRTVVLYVEFEESEQGPGTGGVLHWIHVLAAIDIRTGRFYAPPLAVAEGSGDQAYLSGPTVRRPGGGKDYFDTRFLTCRCMTLDPVNHVLYLAYGDPGDAGPYSGWILGYGIPSHPGAHLALQAVWCAAPSGRGTGSTGGSAGAAGIWQSGGAIAVDHHGNLYVETGNGTFDTTTVTPPYVADGRLARLTDNALIPGGLKTPRYGDYGDAAVKLAPDLDTYQHADNPNGFGLHVADYFVPRDEQVLNDTDRDLGSSSPVLLPNGVGNARHRRLLVINDKQGIIYLLDRDNMGGYHGDKAGDGRGGRDEVVQRLHATGAAFSTAAFWTGPAADRGIIYYVTVNDYAQAFAITQAHIRRHPLSTSRQSYGRYGYPGSTPEISAQGGRDGILWTLDRGRNCLVAYSAGNLRDRLFRSNQDSQALTGRLLGFPLLTVAAGHVYVGTSDALNVYGLKPGASPKR